MSKNIIFSLFLYKIRKPENRTGPGVGGLLPLGVGRWHGKGIRR
jgi:hypothetical protein